MTSIYIPTSSFESNGLSNVLKELFFVPYEEMSPREQAWVMEAQSFGDLYFGEYTVLENGVQVFSCDLGSPEHVVEIRVPKWFKKEKAVFLLMKVAEEVMECQ